MSEYVFVAGVEVGRLKIVNDFSDNVRVIYLQILEN